MLSTAYNHEIAYRSISHGVSRIYSEDGIRGFYRGLVPSLFGVSHGALQFMVYEQLKGAQYSPWARDDGQLKNLDYLMASSLSKAIAGTATYPYQVVRSRLQTYDADQSHRNLRDAVANIWQNERLHGLYKGLVPNLLRVVPSSCVTLLVYENTKIYLKNLNY